ncbi:hypothetical protein [Paenibacillus durus]|nr:hypothetical protein [Paenibacillus durus]
MAESDSVDCSKLHLDFLPKQEEIITKMLDIDSVKMDKSLNEAMIRDMLKSFWPLPRTNNNVIFAWRLTSQISFIGIYLRHSVCSRFPDWGLDQATEDTMREKHKWFVTQTLHAIGNKNPS